MAKTSPAWTMSSYHKWARKHPNFVTPNIIKAKRKKKTNTVVELSSGRGVFDRKKTLYGVTRIRHTKGRFKTAGGKMFRNRKSADKYMKKLLK